MSDTMDRPKLYPRCFLGWWVTEDDFQQITQFKPRWNVKHNEWHQFGDTMVFVDNAFVVPRQEFESGDKSDRCIQITEDMCEPDPELLVEALQNVMRHCDMKIASDALRAWGVDVDNTEK